MALVQICKGLNTSVASIISTWQLVHCMLFHFFLLVPFRMHKAVIREKGQIAQNAEILHQLLLPGIP
jgi:hypothetical protein